MQQRFAHISDLHLTSLVGSRRGQLLNKRLLGYLSWRRKRRFEHRREVLDTLLEALPPDDLCQILITGDLTHVGLPEEFREAADWLRSWAAPEQVALVPGNHDAYVATRPEDTLALWRDYVCDDEGATAFPTLRVRGQIAFIGVSSALATLPLLATGEVGPAQREALARVLRATAERGLFRVVYMHHCPVAGVHRRRKRLVDESAVTAVLAREGVELVLHGHGHRAQWHELPTTSGVAPVLSVPSASARGVHGEPAGFSVLSVSPESDGWQLEVERFGYSSDTGRFAALAPRRVNISRPASAPANSAQANS
jgi:3',5'-cyclic AMP phosphodiesterase CpdA